MTSYPSLNESLATLPAVGSLAERADGLPRKLAVVAARATVDGLRRRLRAGEEVDLSEDAVLEEVRRTAELLSRTGLRQVINATGVILHTNLGRAPIAAEAAAAAELAGACYTNLEYDLESGERGSRQSHIEPSLRELSGAEAGIAVNNNAAGVLLAASALGGGGEIVVSRGQLIEIGGSFRIPEIVAQSGATLVEVGTTNRTRLADFERAIGSQTSALLRVHQSNFRMLGFTEEVGIAELCRLGASHGVPVIDDLGSGAVEEIGDEPLLQASVKAGAALVCCSADKLLGGPQAGVIVGTAEAVDRCRKHPLARALRLDAMQLAALEATLRLHLLQGSRAAPVLAMLSTEPGQLRQRAEVLARTAGAAATIVEGNSRVGGGSLPAHDVRGAVCAIDPAADDRR